MDRPNKPLKSTTLADCFKLSRSNGRERATLFAQVRRVAAVIPIHAFRYA